MGHGACQISPVCRAQDVRHIQHLLCLLRDCTANKCSMDPRVAGMGAEYSVVQPEGRIMDPRLPRTDAMLHVVPAPTRLCYMYHLLWDWTACGSCSNPFENCAVCGSIWPGQALHAASLGSTLHTCTQPDCAMYGVHSSHSGICTGPRLAGVGAGSSMLRERGENRVHGPELAGELHV